jgi:amino acid adenylation domain-containing protein
MTMSEAVNPPADGATAAAGFALSCQQRRLWLLQADGVPPSCQCTVEIAGSLDRGRLRQACRRAVERHGILRTSFRHRPGIRTPVQDIQPRGAPAWHEIDLSRLGRAPRESAAAAVAAAQRERGHGGAAEALRISLLGLASDRHLLVLTLPTLCADARTLVLLLDEIAGRAAANDDEPVQYVEFAAWQSRRLASEEAAAGLAWWRRPELAAAGPPALPWESQPTGDGRPAPATIREVLAPEVAARLATAAERRSAALGTLLAAAWQVLLWRLGRQTAFAVEVMLDGRPDEELQAVVGPLAGAVPVPVRLAGERRFDDVVGELEAALAVAAGWQDFLPPGRRAAEPGVGFEYQSWRPTAAPGGLAWRLRDRQVGCEPFALLLSCVETGELALELRWARRWLAAEHAERLVRCLATLLAGVAAAPESPIGCLPLLDDRERARLLARAKGPRHELAPELLVHRLVTAQVRRTPLAVAAEFQQRQLTYAELEARANRLAHRLIREGIGPERLVAVCLLDPLAMLAGLLAILKAGGAYLPLDPTYPRERLALMLTDASAALLLTERELLAALPADVLPALSLDAEGQAIAAESPGEPAAAAAPENLAYVLYTSGSTGRPKAVMVPHRGLANYLLWATEAYAVAAGRGAPVHSPLGFDLTLTALLTPLLAGRTVFFVPVERGVEALGSALLAGDDFSLVKLTPAHLGLLGRWLPGERLGGRARALVVGGEALSGEQLRFWRQHAPATRLINEYGPTEAVVGCCAYEIPAGEPAAGPVPLGNPIANTRVYVLDADLEPLPPAVAGEICVGGAGLARGYLGHPDLTAERFVPDPWSELPGGRMYRTGDLARFDAGLALEFLGRRDGQVKLRGFRVELGEVEAVLTGHPGVAACAAVVREDEPGVRRLVAYVVPAAAPGPKVSELLAAARRKLPEAMVPAAFVTLPQLPLDAHGKLDRRALPPPEAARPALAAGYVAPESELERRIGAAWRQGLRLERVGIHDNFFDLGGDSFLVFQVHRAMVEAIGRDFPVMRMFQHPTIHALAAYLAAPEERIAAGAPAAAAGRKTALQQRRRQRGKARGVGGAGEVPE